MDQPAALDDRLAALQKRSVFICTPIARHPVRQYTVALAKTVILLAQMGIRCYVQTVVGSSNLPRARNELVAAFMASDYTDMLFIDDDMGWDPKAVVRLLAANQPLIGAVGCKKVFLPDTVANKWCFRSLKGGALNQDEMGNIEVEALGTAFMLIDRSVFETMKGAHPDWKRRGWPEMSDAQRAEYFQFFRFDPHDPDETGEDIAFCQEWRRQGGRVFVDPTIKLVHVGEMEFTGDFSALLAPAEMQQAAE